MVPMCKRWKRRNRYKNHRLYCGHLIAELSAYGNNVVYQENYTRNGQRYYGGVRFAKVTMVGGIVKHG
jgi:hypothetical protein